MRIFLTLFLISLIVISKAQIYTQLDAGYNFPIYEKNDLWTDAKIFDNYTYLKSKDAIKVI